MPVFGSILAVLFLGETFYVYHAIGIAMIARGNPAGIRQERLRSVSPASHCPFGETMARCMRSEMEA